MLSNVLKLAEYPNTYVKLTPQPHKSSLPYPHRDTFPTFKRLYDAYGPDRLMWGTNFPGVMKATGYAPSLEMFKTHMEFLSNDDKDSIFSKNALRIWSFGKS
jgi:predicted TIM-barrel fold metal-dependent hydrolase